MVIVHLPSEDTLRFSEIKRKLPQVTEANLTMDLRLLGGHRMVHREVHPVVPPPEGGILAHRDGQRIPPHPRRAQRTGGEAHR